MAGLVIFMSACTKKSTNTPINDPTVNTFSGKMEQIWDETVDANPKAFLDLDNGMVYDVTTAPSHAKDIDLIWTHCSAGEIICSPNEYYDAFAPFEPTSPNFQTAILFKNWSQRNQTIIDFSTTKTVADFRAIATSKNVTDFIGTSLDFTASQFSYMSCTSADFNKIYMFETTTAGVKKRGLIHFISGQAQNNNFVNFEIKVQD